MCVCVLLSLTASKRAVFVYGRIKLGTESGDSCDSVHTHFHFSFAGV